MRSISLLTLVAALAWLPASAQSTLQLDVAPQVRGPNTEAAQRPQGPNAQVANRGAIGPNTDLARADRLLSEPYYPSCGAAGAARALPLRRGEPGYSRQLDRNGDGVACEQGHPATARKGNAR